MVVRPWSTERMIVNDVHSRLNATRTDRLVTVDSLTALCSVDAVTERISAGFLYGDFQFAIDPHTPDFLTRGVFSCYRPVSDSTPIPEDQRALSPDDWQALLLLAHTDKGRAFDGTVRFIERDEETWLAWADASYACAVFNLHTPHTEEGVARSAAAFRRLIDLAVERSGSYYLTYHRWADRKQVSACYRSSPSFWRSSVATIRTSCSTVTGTGTTRPSSRLLEGASSGSHHLVLIKRPQVWRVERSAGGVWVSRWFSGFSCGAA